ncbi:hypothetical protein B5C26_00965 [Photorhabdus luminescens]|nr:hypothetical protein B5C26_00965 [Photorhabdus luminescens]
MSCSYCGSRLHTIANCPNTWGSSVRRIHLRCSYCGHHGHNSNACPHNASSGNRRKVNDDYFLD